MALLLSYVLLRFLVTWLLRYFALFSYGWRYGVAVKR